MNDNKRLIEQLQTEVDTAYSYQQIALVQTDEAMKEVLSGLSKIEGGHAKKMLEKVHQFDPNYTMPEPSKRMKLQLKIGALFGYGFLLNNLASVEKNIATGVVNKKRKEGIAPSNTEANHLNILNSLSENAKLNLSGRFFTKLEKRHKTVGGNALRAAVLGANDGLVSNMSLIMGVAGAAVSNGTILLTGFSGMLAGAISMSLGEWISVQSSRELNQRQIDLEEEELTNSPEEEQKELALLYQAKGLKREAAEELAEQMFKDKDTALNALITEELGIDKDDLGGSPWEAAITSFLLFAVGAIIPLFPFFFLEGMIAVYASLLASLVGMFAIGAAITLFTGKSVWVSGMRQVIFGIAAAAVTFGIGHFIGVSIAG